MKALSLIIQKLWPMLRKFCGQTNRQTDWPKLYAFNLSMQGIKRSSSACQENSFLCNSICQFFMTKERLINSHSGYLHRSCHILILFSMEKFFFLFFKLCAVTNQERITEKLYKLQQAK